MEQLDPARTQFRGRKVWIATKHSKEQVIAPLLEKHLELNWEVPEDFDTDQFGSFSGEVQRKGNALDAARKKCELLLKITGGDLAIASEGSFGPDPITGFGGLDDELILLVDLKNQREFIGRMLSNSTNFAGKQIQTEEELNRFLDQVKFPSHGLIIKRFKEDSDEIIKGIRNPQLLRQIYDLFQKKFGQVFLETDMRALYNPTRMEIIKMATQNLIHKLQSICPKCKSPGFQIIDRKSGLPCRLCGQETELTLSETYGCQVCEYQLEKKYPNVIEFASPQYCNHCNP